MGKIYGDSSRFEHLVGYGQPLGIILVLMPWTPKRPKERAYVALGIVYISALYVHLMVDGFIWISLYSDCHFLITPWIIFDTTSSHRQPHKVRKVFFSLIHKLIMTIVMNSHFVTSSPSILLCPPPDRAEIVMIGKSNVGKSSLINALCHKKELAKTSGKPGKTQLINYFALETEGRKQKKQWYLVDVPGYGYAKATYDQRDQRAMMLEDYLVQRKTIQHICVLVDSRHPPQKSDISCILWLIKTKKSFCLIFTKRDKTTQKEMATNLAGRTKVVANRGIPFPIYFIANINDPRTIDSILDHCHKQIKE